MRRQMPRSTWNEAAIETHEFRTAVGAGGTFLPDPGRRLQKDVQVGESARPTTTTRCNSSHQSDTQTLLFNTSPATRRRGWPFIMLLDNCKYKAPARRVRHRRARTPRPSGGFADYHSTEV